MRFDERFLDELKSRLRPSEVIGQSVKLRRQGREWVGLSPFNKEKSPSFYVNDDKGFYHDFSSGKHGDIINFLMETQNYSFSEAVEKLAQLAGISLPAPSPEHKEIQEKSKTLRDLLSEAQGFFVAQLHKNDEAADKARSYLKGRGLTPDDWNRFGLGVSPIGPSALKDFLIQKGFHPAQMIEAGLLIQVEGQARTYDRFRERIQFPIKDARGQLISFGGRALNPQDKAKYLNGPETALFHKSHHLYGLDEAIKIALQDKQTPLVIVEGYMDVIACHKAGIAAMAPMGTALSEEQMKLIWRRHDEPILCFDGDGAGIRAAHRAMDRALPHLKPGQSFGIVFLPEGQDPDDILRKSGPKALKDALLKKQSFVDALFEREKSIGLLATPEQKAGLRKRLKALALQIADKDLQDAYRNDLIDRYDSLFRPKTNPIGFPIPFQPNQNRRVLKKGAFNQYSNPIPSSALNESKAAAKALSQSLDPLLASVFVYWLGHMDDGLDFLEPIDQAISLEPCFKPLGEFLLERIFSSSRLDKPDLERHMADKGLDKLWQDIQAAAPKSSAPYLNQETPHARRQRLWLTTVNALSRLAALQYALNLACQNMQSDPAQIEQMGRLKTDLDELRRALKSGQIWQDEDAIANQT
jgi:DNA primase